MKKIILFSIGLISFSFNSIGQSTNSAPYCAGAAIAPNVHAGITNVSIGSLNNTTDASTAYTYYTNLPPIVLIAGKSYPLNVTFNQTASDNSWYAVGFDFNHSGTSADNSFGANSCSPAFYGYTNSSVYNQPVTYWASVDIPANAPLGKGRMRVTRFSKVGSTPSLCGSCLSGSGDFGETEDYDIIVNDSAHLAVEATPAVNNISIFPNPTTGIIHIRASQNLPSTVYDMLGREILKGSDNDLDISNYPAGIYLLKVNNSVYKIQKY